MRKSVFVTGATNGRLHPLRAAIMSKTDIRVITIR